MKKILLLSGNLFVVIKSKIPSAFIAASTKKQLSWLVLMRYCLLLLLLTASFGARAQVSVTGGTAAAGSYSSLNDALTAVNANIATGAINITITGPYAETTPVKGLTLGSATLNPTLSATNTITISTTGGTVTLNAGIGTKIDDLSNTEVPDGMLMLLGADHVIIDGLTFTDNNNSAPATMEYGIALFKRTTGDGCNNNLIQHCTFNMKAHTEQATKSSGAIIVLHWQQTPWGGVSNEPVPTNGGTLATNGTNSGNKFYSNTIVGGHRGIFLSGYSGDVGSGAIPDPNTFLGDLGNDIGGNSAATGNTITLLSHGSSTADEDIYGINASRQWNLNISYNIVNNNLGSWANSLGEVWGILCRTVTGYPINPTTYPFRTVINNNTVSILSSGLFGAGPRGIFYEDWGAEYSTTAVPDTISIQNNTVKLGELTGQNTLCLGIDCLYLYGTFLITGNTIGQIEGAALYASGTSYMIHCQSNYGIISNNTISNFNLIGSGGTFAGIRIAMPVAEKFTVTGNTIEAISWANGYQTPGGTKNIDGITIGEYANSSDTSKISITNNIIRNLSIHKTGTIAGIHEYNSKGNKSYQNNQVYNFYTSAGGEGGATMRGIMVEGSGTSSHTFSGNQIYSLNSTELYVGTIASVAGISVSSGTANAVFNNRICDLSSTSTNPAVSGIIITGGTTNTIYNNRIGDLRAPAADARNPINGISISGSTAAKVYYNTIHLNATSTGTTFGSSGVFYSGDVPVPTLDLRNNIIINNSTANSVGRTVVLRRSTGSANIIPSNYDVTSNNNLFYAGVPSASRLIYAEGINTLNNIHQLLSTYKTFMSTRDQASVTENPTFLSTACGGVGYLKLNTGVASQAIGGAVNISGISLDFENDVRQGNPGYTGAGTAPDMGADETNSGQAVFCSGSPVVSTINGAASVCSGSGTTLSLSAGEYGITYAWFSGTTAGGPYPTALGTSPTLATGNLTVPTYYICITTCTSSGLSFTTPEKAVMINALPAVAVNPPSSSFCTPGGTAVTLTASGAATYTWSPSTGLSATTGAVVSASPASSTTYTVTGTDGNGCVNTAAASVSALQNPQAVVATASPATICSGLTSSLSVTATIPSTVKAYSFNGAGTGSLDPMTGAAIVVGTKTDDAPMNTSNGANSTAGASLLIGFNFPYEGVNYTHFAASPDGWIRLGTSTSAATAQFTNSISSATNTPKISPYWDDMATGTTGSVQTLITGTAPNRVFKVQWFVTIPRNTTGAANSTFQAWLYESSGLIEFRYGTMGTTGSSSAGLTGFTSTNFNSISFSSNTASNTVANDLNSVAPANGTLYSFTPPGGLSYAWSPSGNVVNPGAQTTMTGPLTSTVNFQVVVSNGTCSASPVSVTVTVNSSSSVAEITGHPASSAKCAGQTATFTATATGPGLSYQWFKNSTGNPINTVSNPSAATATLSLSNVSASDAADYFAGITANCGTQVFSNAATLAVTTPLAGIIVSPSATLCAGQSVTLTENGGNATSWSWSAGGVITQQVTVTPSVTGTYSVTATVNGCSATANQTLTVNPAPTAITISPASAAICPGGSVNLLASGGMTNLAGMFNGSSGAISLPIPDFSATGVSHDIAVSAVPAGAVIDSVIVTFNITHAYDADIELNLEAPNGQVINLVADRGSSGDNFTNTRISSDITRALLSSGTAPFSGTFRADAAAQGSLIGSPAVTTQTFSNLFSIINGNWTIRAYDDESTDAGTLNNWAIKISYTGPVQGNFSWSPITGLDVASGTAVIASPVSTTTYTATSTNVFGCINSSDVTVAVNVLPTVNFSGLASSYCTTSPPVTLTGSPVGGTFSGPGITGNSFDPAAAGAGTHSITYSYTDGNGCSNSTSQQVRVNAVCTPAFATLNLTAFLEGFYSDINTMRANIYDQGISSDPAETDTVTVNLWAPVNLSNPEPDHSIKAVIHTDGTATIQFPATVNGNPYYIAVKHRNHMETWSKLPVTFTGTTTYDFSDALGKAYDDGANPPMAAVAGGKFAFYGGDVNQDGTVDASDMADVDNDNAAFAFGYNVTDASGDGATDASDISIVDNNQQLFLFYARPF